MNWNIFLSEELDLIPLNFPTECRPCFIQNLLPFNRELLWVCQVWHAVACWDVKVLAAHSALQRDCIVLWPKFSWNGTKGEKGRREQDTGGVSSLSAALDHVKCQQRKNILVMFTDKCWWQHFQTPNLKKTHPKHLRLQKSEQRRWGGGMKIAPVFVLDQKHIHCVYGCVSARLVFSSWTRLGVRKRRRRRRRSHFLFHLTDMILTDFFFMWQGETGLSLEAYSEGRALKSGCPAVDGWLWGVQCPRSPSVQRGRMLPSKDETILYTRGNRLKQIFSKWFCAQVKLEKWSMLAWKHQPKPIDAL